jgi:D-psicose/D-tagatose/L-ribulose 3-epimerase
VALVVSNIAWPADEESDVGVALADLGVTAVEIAPTKVFPDPLRVSDAEVEGYLSSWARHGISVVAFQSMLFGRPELTIFIDADTRKRALERMRGFIQLAGRMQAGVLVFGSPKNRRIPPGMGKDEALDVATAFFSELASEASNCGTVLCIEPNPEAYDCNFVTTSTQGADLVARVDSPGFGLHLDVAGMTLAQENVAEAILAQPDIRHFHVSAPHLGELEETTVDHSAAASALERIGYAGHVSIEMRPGEAGQSVARVRRAVSLARHYYGSVI